MADAVLLSPMNPIAVLGWLIGLVGAGLVGIGALLILNQAYGTAFVAAIVGIFTIVAGMAAVSIPKRHQGLGVIY